MARVAILLIALVVVFTTLDQAQGFFAPVFSALVFGIILSPLSNFWDRIGLRASFAALATVIISLCAMVSLVFLLEPYIAEAVERAPIIWFELRDAIEGIRAMILGFEEITEEVVDAVDPDNTDVAAEKEAIDVPSMTAALLYAPQYRAQFMMVVGVLYYFLLTRREIYAWLGGAIDQMDESDFLHAEHQVAQYFLTITGINLCFGALVVVVMQLLGMPAPMFWGVMAFALNYILYLGPIALGSTLLITGIVVFDGAISFAPAALYMAMNATEGQFVTPALVGKRMSVNPLLVFLSLAFWLWLWGPIGGIIAIPLLIWSIAITKGALGQTISSGIPGKLRPNRLAGREA